MGFILMMSFKSNNQHPPKTMEVKVELKVKFLFVYIMYRAVWMESSIP